MNLKICDNGHEFFKTSECPTCPVCERENRPENGFLSILSAPARRAFENKGILTLEQLAKFTEKEILGLHGMGKSSIPKLVSVLEQKKRTFRNH